MLRQLSVYFLNEIFEYLEEDKVALHSCLLVNRLWCEISVEILWRNVWRFRYTLPIKYQSDMQLKILNTLIACFPDESKDLLHKNGILITTQTWKPSLFNYASFCKVLSIYEMDLMIHHVLEKQQSITSQTLNFNKYLVLQEILKMFMSQISSLKSLDYHLGFAQMAQLPFTYFPG